MVTVTVTVYGHGSARSTWGLSSFDLDGAGVLDRFKAEPAAPVLAAPAALSRSATRRLRAFGEGRSGRFVGKAGRSFMALEVEAVALELVAELRTLMPRIRRADRSLADQLSRAASSVVLNICEAAYSDPGNRRARFHSAAGSANEVRGALRLAKAWGYVSAEQTRAAEGLLDRVVAMLWKLKR